MRIIGIIGLLLLSTITNATELQTAYLQKFQTYIQWRDNLPTTPTPEFLTFIQQNLPLNTALRERWLYQLALSHDWNTFEQYYQASNDPSLQCYSLIASDYLEQKSMMQSFIGHDLTEAQNKDLDFRLANNSAKLTEIKNKSINLWLNLENPPSACVALFNLLLKQNAFSNELIEQRILLALEQNQTTLAHDLLLKLNPAQTDEANLLMRIHHNPKLITKLTFSKLHSAFYLYGLHALIPKNMDLALKIWAMPQSKNFLVTSQKQNFIKKIALYKAMRNAPDTDLWFARIKPEMHTQITREWQIRYALLHQNWYKVVTLIPYLEDSDAPIWQYWLARSYQALHQQTKATELFQQIAMKRNYYGFLASLRLKQPLMFEHNTNDFVPDLSLLAVYKPILDDISKLYFANNQLAASRLINAFLVELPPNEQIQITYWVANSLHWYSKSVALSMTEALNNHLELRFPLAELDDIKFYTKKYQINPALVYAIIRQESAFREDIRSSAGAYGLMQLLPTTAKNTAKYDRIKFNDSQQLFIPQKNIEIGVAYLRQLAKAFHANPVLMAAAYNAGPKQVRLWLNNNKTTSLDLWIESLPWIETRNYVKNIIAFYAVYQYLLDQHIDLAFMLAQPSEGMH